MELLDFELEVSPAADGGFTVSVLRSPAGEATATMRFPFDSLALENRLQALQIALLRSGNMRRRVDTPEAETVRRFGQELWDVLFTGDILAAFEVSRTEARQRDAGIRVKLRIVPPDLAALPWEYLYDSRRGDYLTLSMATPLVRYIPLPQAIEPLLVVPPLRILAMIASPSDLPALDVERERQRLEQATAQLRQRGVIELTWLPGQTWRDLSQALRQQEWHIFHFIGHGAFDQNRSEGLVVFESEKGGSERFSATDLGRLLGDHGPLRLAVLNSCESARGDQADIFSSTAATLVRAGTPAVVAMQYEITDSAAIEFSRSFYDAIADGIPVDSALSEARKGIAFAIPGTLEWGTPVLFMRSPDGKLFDLAPRPKDEPATLPIAAVASGAAGPAAAAPSLPTPATTGMPPIIAPSAGPPPSPPAPAADSARAQGQPAPTVPAEQPVVVDGGRGRRTPALVGLLLFGGIAVVVLALLAASGFIGGGGPTSPPVIGAGGGGSTVAPPTVPTGSAAGLTSPPPTVPTGSAAGPASVPPNGTPTSSAVIAGGSAPPSAAVGPTGRIVYSSDRQGIVIAAADGSGASVVPGTATTDTDPAWSPDGTNVVFGSAGGIRISPVDVARGVEFSDGGRDDVAPCWSSQGEIAFASRRDGRYQIYVGPADRSAPPQRFRANANTEADPAWSPDGLLLAFVSDRGGDDEIDVVKRDGSGFRQLTSNDARDVDPAWSPDGNLIVFASDLDHAGDYDLWTMKSDGTGLTVLTSGPEIDHDPTWSPDGRFIAFSRSSAGQRGADIVILDLATRSLRLLTNREGSSKFPFWH